MKSTIRLLLWVAAVASVAVSPAVAGFGDVVASFPSPGGEPTALTWANGNLYCYCQASPYLFWKIRPGDGEVLGSFLFGHTPASLAGLAYDGQYFWTGSTKENVIYRFAWGGSVISSYKVSWDYGRGLTWTGLHLWGAEIGTKWSHGYFQMRADCRIIRSYSSLYEIFDLAWDGGNFWTAEYDDIADTYHIIGFNPIQGSFVGSFDSPGDKPRGAACDGRYLWLSTIGDEGYLWKVNVGNIDVQPDSLGRVKALFR